jgi:signal transduction histidine kinase/ABC-type amino acid transport substrate-binding protein
MAHQPPRNLAEFVDVTANAIKGCRRRRLDSVAGLHLALVMLAMPLPGAAAQAAIETPRTIRVVMDDAYAPYSFRSDDGALQGILVDQWQAWERKTGIRVDVRAMDWGEALQRMRAGEFDVIDSIVETPERRNDFDFTSASTPIEASIYFRKDISGITTLGSLKGFPVGVKNGDQHVDQLEASGVTTVIPFHNNDAIIQAAQQHKINVFVVDNPSALYLLNKAGIEDDFRHSPPIFRDQLRRAVRKGNAALLRTVSAGFAAVGPAELEKIDEKWFGSPINQYGRYAAYAGYASATLVLLVAGLLGWNGTLRKRVLRRTAALAESEQRFRRLVELMPVAVYTCDTSGTIQSYNRRAVELWGREPGAADTAQRYCGSLRLYSPDGTLVPHEESKMAEVLRTGIEARDLEVVIERPDASRILVMVNIAPLRSGEGELIGAINCFTDITERKQAETALLDSAAQLRAVSRRLVDLQESERRQLSRELHDRVGQNLTALKINLEILEPLFAEHGDVAVRARVTDSAALLETTMDTIENVLSELRPPMLDDHGLAAALDWHARAFSRRTGIAVAVKGSEPAVRPARAVELELFRITQEALNNVAKHARARRVEITLEHAGGECLMCVQDDGIGFTGVDDRSSQARPGLGMVTMKERSLAIGGRFEVVALPDRGTRLTVRVPY